MSRDPAEEAKVKDFLENPGNRLAFMMAASPGSDVADCILLVNGEHVIGKIDFPEAWDLADFLYTHLPPRNKAGVN